MGNFLVGGGRGKLEEGSDPVTQYGTGNHIIGLYMNHKIHENTHNDIIISFKLDCLILSEDMKLKIIYLSKV